MSDKARLRRQLRRFHKEDPRCRWCLQKTRLIPLGELREWPAGKPFPKDMATIDHLYSRLHPQRGRVNGLAHTLACRQCNNETRSAHECSVVFRDEHQRRTHEGLLK